LSLPSAKEEKVTWSLPYDTSLPSQNIWKFSVKFFRGDEPRVFKLGFKGLLQNLLIHD
jgi:hypothetical protein